MNERAWRLLVAFLLFWIAIATTITAAVALHENLINPINSIVR